MSRQHRFALPGHRHPYRQQQHQPASLMLLRMIALVGCCFSILDLRNSNGYVAAFQRPSLGFSSALHSKNVNKKYQQHGLSTSRFYDVSVENNGMLHSAGCTSFFGTKVTKSALASTFQNSASEMANETLATSSPSTTIITDENEPHKNSFNSRLSTAGKRRNNGRYSKRKSYRSYQDVYGLNEALNRLAEQAGDARHSVIQKAMAAEELWKEFNLGEVSSEEAGATPSPRDTLRSDVVSFNIVLKAWSKATQVLATHQNNRNHDHLLDADIPIYTARECALHALDLLNQQEELAALNSAASASSDDDDDDAVSDNQAAGMPGNDVPAPDVHSYNTVLDTWANSRTDTEAIRQVEDLLGRLQKSPDLEPDVISYNALVEVYGSSQEQNRLEKLRRIWQYMDQTPALYPGTRATSSFLHSYSSIIREDPSLASELAEEAQTKFDSLKQRFAETGNPAYEPDVMVYTNIMDVWSKVGKLDAVEKVEDIFQELKDQHQKSTTRNNNGGLQPSSYTYSSLISAWTRVASSPINYHRKEAEMATERVAEILDEMIDNRELMILSNHPFTAAMKCWSHGKSKGKAVRALNTLQQMKELAKIERRVTPSIHTYHAALDCCAQASVDGDLSEDTVSLKIAFAILKAMNKEGIDPTNVTFSKLLNCVENLLPSGNERNTVVEATFTKARAAGMADGLVIRSFKRAADGALLQKTLGDIMADRNGYIDFKKIPYAWRKNVR